MSIYILTWIKEDLEAVGDSITNYTLLDLKKTIEKYNQKYN